MGSKNCSCYDFVHQSYNIETDSTDTTNRSQKNVVSSEHLPPKDMAHNSAYDKTIKIPNNIGESQYSLGLRPAA